MLFIGLMSGLFLLSLYLIHRFLKSGGVKIELLWMALIVLPAGVYNNYMAYRYGVNCIWTHINCVFTYMILVLAGYEPIIRGFSYIGASLEKRLEIYKFLAYSTAILMFAYFSLVILYNILNIHIMMVIMTLLLTTYTIISNIFIINFLVKNKMFRYNRFIFNPMFFSLILNLITLLLVLPNMILGKASNQLLVNILFGSYLLIVIIVYSLPFILNRKKEIKK